MFGLTAAEMAEEPLHEILLVEYIRERQNKRRTLDEKRAEQSSGRQ